MDYKRVLALHFINGMSSRDIAKTTGDVDYCDLLDELLVLSRSDDLDKYRKKIRYYARIALSSDTVKSGFMIPQQPGYVKRQTGRRLWP